MQSFFSSFKKEDIYSCYIFISNDMHSDYTLFRLKPIHDAKLLRGCKDAFSNMQKNQNADYIFMREAGLITIQFVGSRYDIINAVRVITQENLPTDIFGFAGKSIQAFLAEKMMHEIKDCLESLTLKKTSDVTPKK